MSEYTKRKWEYETYPALQPDFNIKQVNADGTADHIAIVSDQYGKAAANAQLIAAAPALLEALKRYGMHQWDCDVEIHGNASKCTCGYLAAIASVEPDTKKDNRTQLTKLNDVFKRVDG